MLHCGIAGLDECPLWAVSVDRHNGRIADFRYTGKLIRATCEKRAFGDATKHCLICKGREPQN